MNGDLDRAEAIASEIESRGEQVPQSLAHYIRIERDGGVHLFSNVDALCRINGIPLDEGRIRDHLELNSDHS